MRTLSDVFAARGPLLPEGLRTLEVSPNRIIEPGMTVHAAFTFRNLGGGTASGFRVRFRLPEGLTYLVGTARIDETPLDEQGGLTTLLQTSGADIGEIPAGGARRVSLAYTVANTIENGTPVTIQAAIASFDVPVIGSNIVRLVVRSRPVLQNPKTLLSIVPIREALPGEELQLSAKIHNSGQSSAHDLVVLLPLPPQTTYSPDSVTIDGRAVPATAQSEPFGYARPSVIAPTLGPGATVAVGYRVRIDSPLEDATPIAAHGSVCSREVAEFALPPAIVKIPSAAAFSGDDTSFRVECDDEVVAGQRMRIVLHARNIGTARARKVTLRIVLPPGIAYTPASLTIDGAPSPDGGSIPDAIALGDLEPGRSVELAMTGVVQTPIPDGHELRLSAIVAWSKGQRKFERSIVARSGARFPATFNRIERETPRRVEPGDAIAYTIALENMGSDVATEVRLHVTCDPGIERVRIHDRDTEVALGDDGTIGLDTLEPGAARRLRIDARVAGVIEDQTNLRVHATLRTAGLEPIELGAPLHVVASRPRFTPATSQLTVEGDEVLRPNRTSTCRVSLANEGTDRGRDVCVVLQLPDELRLERVDDATHDGNTVLFGDIPAGETREALLHLRLVGIVSHGDVLTIAARAGGLNVVPFALRPIELSTHAEAAFAEGAILASQPAETIDAGAELTYTLSLRNSGDGAAKRLVARVATLEHAVYAPGSTTVNGISLQDFAGTSPLMSESGLTLADVGAGVEVIARWRVIVNMPLPPSTTIETAAHVAWDEAPEITVTAPIVRVRSGSALPIIEPELPFSVLGAVAAPSRPQSVLGRTEIGSLPPAPAYAELLPAVPVGSSGRNGGGNGYAGDGSDAGSAVTVTYAQLTPSDDDIVPPKVEDVEPAGTTLFLELSDEHLTWVVQYLEQTRVGGLVAHLLALRALVPDRVGGADRLLRARLLAYREQLGQHVDRLFIKVRLPDFPLETADLETSELRGALVHLFEEFADVTPERPAVRSGLRLVETIDAGRIEPVVKQLENAALGTAAPWRALAMLVGTSLERDGGSLADFSAYRDAVIAELSRRAELDPASFQAALRGPVAPSLDEAREELLRRLTEQQRVLS
jgi:uncharacterized repeat protein (TIGR01451 family)